MKEHEMQKWMVTLFEEQKYLPLDGKNKVSKVETYKEAGIIAFEKGLVVTMNDGVKFNVTIAKNM